MTPRSPGPTMTTTSRPLRTNLGDHPAWRPIKTGTLSAPGLAFDFCGPKSPPAGFRGMVEAGAYDVGELALGTYLHAVAYGKPVILLPLTITARFQHHTIVCRADAHFPPEQVTGKCIGVRSYTQTTGIWVRAILSETYGVDLDAVTWVTAEGAHVADYADPPNVERLGPGSPSITDLLLAGDLDAAIFGADMPDAPDLVPLIPDPQSAARAWYARHGYVPVNHMLAVNRDLAARDPGAVLEVYRLFAEAKARMPASEDGIDLLPAGLAAVRAPVEAMVEHALRQRIIPRRLEFEDLFADARRLLGD